MKKRMIENLYDYDEYDLKAFEIFDGKEIVGNINKEHLTYDEYKFEIKDLQKDINLETIGYKKNNIKVKVYPLDTGNDGYVSSANLAAYVEESDVFDCGTTPPYGRKTMALKTKNHTFVINGRFVKNQFVSSVNTSDIAEDRKISYEKVEIRTKDNSFHCMKFKDGNIQISVIPLSLKNIKLYVPILVVIQKENGVVVGASQSYFTYEGIKLGCRWYEDELICYRM